MPRSPEQLDRWGKIPILRETYDELLERLQVVEAKIAALDARGLNDRDLSRQRLCFRSLLRDTTKVYDAPSEPKTVELGAVVIFTSDDGQIKGLTKGIVGSEVDCVWNTKADKANKAEWISEKGPIGQAIVGKEAGVAFSYFVGGKKCDGSILEISPLPCSSKRRGK